MLKLNKTQTTFPAVVKLSSSAKAAMPSDLADAMFVIQTQTSLEMKEAEYHQMISIAGQTYYSARAYSFSIDAIVDASKDLDYIQFPIDRYFG